MRCSEVARIEGVRNGIKREGFGGLGHSLLSLLEIEITSFFAVLSLLVTSCIFEWMFNTEKTRRKLYSGEYIFDCILRKYYSEPKMEETLRELREMDSPENDEVEFVKELNDEMDIDRRKSSYGGYIYTVTKFKYGGEE